MRIIAYRTQTVDGKVLIEDSTGDNAITNDLRQLLAFLLEPYEERHLKVCWELDATVAPILKLLGKASCVKLNETRRCRWQGLFDVFYMPGKVFSVTYIPRKDRMSLYEVAQFFPELDEPEELVEVQMLGQKLLFELKKIGLEPTKLTSPVAVYEECVMRELDLPVLIDIPKGIAEYAYRCSGRLWIEAHQLGSFEPAYDYDLTSAFPSVARDLVDIRQLEWVQSNEYQSIAVYGYVKCKVTIYDWVEISPILKEDSNGGLYSPVGTWETYLTKGELDFIDRWKIGEYKIIEGWWAIAKEKANRPLAEPLDKLLAYKQQSGLQAAMAKRMSVGLYGKFGEERKREFGPYFNPVWFAEISTQVRLQVAEFLYSNGIGPGKSDRLLHISIDGCLLANRVKGFKTYRKIPVSKNGQWRLNGVTPALVVSSGLVFYADKKPKGIGLEDLLVMIKEHPKVGYYAKRLKRRVTLGDALTQDKFWELGKEVEMTSSIDLERLEHDRAFGKKPKTGQQLLKKHYLSKPQAVF